MQKRKQFWAAARRVLGSRLFAAGALVMATLVMATTVSV